jgi:hypothetical protein
MPTKIKLEHIQAVAEKAARNLALGGRVATPAIARETGVPRRTVRDILSHLGPEVEALKQSQRDEMLMAWHDTFFGAYDELRTGELKPRDRRDLAIVMGISTEKAQLLSGQPTALVANIHEVRVSMVELVSKLGQVARIIEAEPRETTAWPDGDTRG